MENEHTLAGLMRKRAELAGRIDHAQRELNALQIALDHLDCTIRIFDPDADISLSKIKPYPPRHAAYKGEMSRFVLSALRDATGPITSLEVAKSVVEARGLKLEDKQTVILFRKRVGACLKGLKNKGFIEEVPTTGPYKGWVMVR